MSLSAESIWALTRPGHSRQAGNVVQPSARGHDGHARRYPPVATPSLGYGTGSALDRTPTGLGECTRNADCAHRGHARVGWRTSAEGCVTLVGWAYPIPAPRTSTRPSRSTESLGRTTMPRAPRS